MNENIESKLNELLKMKDDLDELKSQRKQQETVDDFEKKQKQVKNYFYGWLAFCVILMMAGVAGIEHNSEKYRINALFIALCGLNGVVLMKLWYYIKMSNLHILQELKQLRLQLTNHTPPKDE